MRAIINGWIVARSTGTDATIPGKLSAVSVLDRGCANGVKKTQGGRAGQETIVRSVAVEELEPLEARSVQIVMYVFGEIFLYIGFVPANSRRPLPRNVLQILRFQSMIPRLLENLGQVERG